MRAIARKMKHDVGLSKKGNEQQPPSLYRTEKASVSALNEEHDLHSDKSWIGLGNFLQ